MNPGRDAVAACSDTAAITVTRPHHTTLPGHLGAASATRRGRLARLGRKRLLVVVGLVAAVALTWTPASRGHVKAMLLLTQVLPQIPVKPLGLLTDTPAYRRVTLDSPHGPIVADMFTPVPRFGGIAARSEPALMLAMGVKTKASDRVQLLALARTFSRLGYVVLWPRLATLDRGLSLPESPETFVRGVRYLARLRVVDPRRIFIVGFSVGSSLALVAATDRRITGVVRALVFFGGYYDIFDYLTSLATGTVVVNGRVVPWRPDRQAVGHVKELLRNERATAVARIFTARTRAQAQAILRAAPPAETAFLRAMSPSYHLKDFRGRIFILHDRSDHFCPYVQSAMLNQALGARVPTRYLISDLFAHTLPKSGMSWQVVGEGGALYGFMHAALSVV